MRRQSHKTRETRVTLGLKKKKKGPEASIHTQSLQWSLVSRHQTHQFPPSFLATSSGIALRKKAPGHESFPNSELSKLHGERTPPRPKPKVVAITSRIQKKRKAYASESFLGRDAEATFISTTEVRNRGVYKLQLLSRATAT